MPSNVEVQDLAALVLDDEETVQDSERRRRNGKEVERDNGLTVVTQECEPLLAGIAMAPGTREVACDGSLGQRLRRGSSVRPTPYFPSPGGESTREAPVRVSTVHHAGAIFSASRTGNRHGANPLPFRA